ncbi:hypothetical protein M885DRAFT_11192 [Pelagophyceae sp. CCMP2097]|nr:hypothetical protein M885DRAFT_11192 [Pelagophyceae sp. CCMP2097]
MFPTLQSSLGCPFLVVSSLQLVEGLPAPAEPDFDGVLAMVENWAVAEVVVLADFEGEMPGFGGRLVVAQFLLTESLDDDLKPTLSHERPFPSGAVGLLVDLRDPRGVEVARRIMESEAITKVIWGADGDLTSLRHQRGLGMRSRNVVDCQLAFSTERYRLGMAEMLKRVPPTELPPKAGHLDFKPQQSNRRALPLPLTAGLAKYSMDDLHRIEVILQTQRPSEQPYAATTAQTASFLASLEEPSCGVVWVRAQQRYVRRKKGDAKTQTQVSVLRAVVHIFVASGGRATSLRSSAPRTSATKPVTSAPNTSSAAPKSCCVCVIDYETTALWYRRAAEQGYPAAQYNLGLLFNKGLGVAQSYAEAVKWCRLAAAQGEADALFNLGVSHVKGRGVSQDFDAALLQARAAKGHDGAAAAVEHLPRFAKMSRRRG